MKLALRLLAFAIVLIAGRAAFADDFFTSSPGALTKSHHDLDDPAKCNECHINNTKDLSNDKCLGCHDHQNLGGRISAGKGFHSSPTVKGKQCQACHHEHKGPGYDIMGWSSIKGGQDAFDHQLTGWPLNGAHQRVGCNDCHKARDRQGLHTFMGTDRLCGTCHQKDSPHGFVRRDMLACERCHSESLWKPEKRTMQFDHNNKKDAGMPLLGSHESVLCTKCHPKALFN
ncbi:MAG TPA: cytochrome c3 family protein, partial [Polyangiales bacterium]|nr:cytochrome c3 family protein [Polyangiales bacterium]